MRKTIKFNEDLNKILDQLPKGAFLTVKGADNVNTMTIGWASFGIIWNKPILMVAVRKSRHTYSLINGAKDFTVSIPIGKNLAKKLKYCGEHSGRDIDKIEDCGLTYVISSKVATPIIKECNYHYECKILFSQFMDKNGLVSSVKSKHYTNDDYHVLYFGEIVESYKFE